MALKILWGSVCLSSWASITVLALNTNDKIGADVDYGSFSNPSSHVRPRFRYWIPDASVDLDVVAGDFAKAKNIGMGGLELLGYYLYGNYPSNVAEGGPVPVDWTKYGWGTEAWKNLTDVALRATKNLGMIMDFAVGPNQGAGVPAQPEDEGVMWELFPYNISVPIGGSFNGTLPGWGSGRFVSASTALVINRTAATYTAQPAWIGPVYYNGTSNVILSSSLQDVTDQVDPSGHLSLSFPNTGGVEYRIFAYYEGHSAYLEQASPLDLNTTVTQSQVTSFVQNGSRVVDHFSAAGASLITKFWDEYLLDDETKELIKEVGNYAWEDSMEIGAGTLLWWTPQLLQAFNTSRGYSLRKYIPLIYSYNTEANGPLASPDRFHTEEPDEGQRYVNDYWQTLTELNKIYLQTLANWSTATLESQFSAQVVYNLPMDMLANVPAVNAPECESLGFDHVIDAYRQFSGPANLAGKRIISSELGAQREEVYEQTLPELIWDVQRSIIGSVNQMVYHGYPYTGDYPNTTWPGFTTFTYRFSAMHGPRQPAWEYYDDYMNWTARVQYVAQSGVPKIDLVFWLKKDSYFSVDSQYLPNDLQEAGYTYEYLSPDNFDLPEAVVGNKTFAPDRQAFKAMILRANDTLTVSGVDKLVEYANAGLPIIFSGGVPQNLTGYNASGTEHVRAALAGISDLDNVHIVPYDNLAASLQSLGITPRTQVTADRTLFTYWREDANASVTYVYVYNDAWDSAFGQGSARGSVTFETTGTPYVYDAWTGEIAPVLAYQQSATATTLALTLAGNQSTIIAFHHDEDPAPHLLSLPDEVFDATPAPDAPPHLIRIRSPSASQPLLLSNGTTIPLPSAPSPIPLTSWSLTVESWSAPPDSAPDQTRPLLSNSSHHNISALRPWNVLDPSALRNVSGRGFYTTTFSWPPPPASSSAAAAAPAADGAYLHLGPLYHTARVWVNGHRLPPLDPAAARADVGAFLRAGPAANEVLVVVSTPLSNAMREVWQRTRSSGTRWLGPEPREQGYGLLGNVTVVPYVTSTVAVA